MIKTNKTSKEYNIIENIGQIINKYFPEGFEVNLYTFPRIHESFLCYFKSIFPKQIL